MIVVTRAIKRHPQSFITQTMMSMTALEDAYWRSSTGVDWTVVRSTTTFTCHLGLAL